MSDKIQDIRQGGCICGDSRYEIDLAGQITSNCHCTDCRRHIGAPYGTFTIVPVDQFRWIKRPTGELRLSDAAVRRFCTQCGTYLKWEGITQSDSAEINTCTIDDPDSLVPTMEIYTKSRMEGVQPVPNTVQYNEGSGD